MQHAHAKDAQHARLPQHSLLLRRHARESSLEECLCSHDGGDLHAGEFEVHHAIAMDTELPLHWALIQFLIQTTDINTDTCLAMAALTAVELEKHISSVRLTKTMTASDSGRLVISLRISCIPAHDGSLCGEMFEANP